MTYLNLSYPLNINDPGFPGEPTLTIEKCTQIEKGDIYNSAKIHLFNHFGTHFDAPRHFNPNGKTISELPLEQFIYEKPLLIDIPKGKASLIEKSDLEPYLIEIKQADCLLIRTGLENLRKVEPHSYAKEGCAFSIEVSEYLIKYTPNLKAVGFDFISLASPANPEHGVKAHQIMLGMFSKNFICIIEDMKLSEINKHKLFQVIAAPLLVKDIDSSQVTVLAKIKE